MSMFLAKGITSQEKDQPGSAPGSGPRVNSMAIGCRVCLLPEQLRGEGLQQQAATPAIIPETDAPAERGGDLLRSSQTFDQ